jgi:putative transposase
MVDVQGQPIDGGETMAKRHRRLDEELVQGALLDDPEFLRQIVEGVLQHLLEAEITEHIGAAPYQRTESRKGHRNGYKPRKLKSRVGTLELLVPQDREGIFSTSLFARYQRNEKALTLALMEMYLEGVSTRKVREVTEELCGTSFSKSTVSRLAMALDSELEEWRHRPLEAESYPYLFVWTPATRRLGSAPGSSARASWSFLRFARTAFERSWLLRWRMSRVRRPTRSCSAL